MPESTDAPEPKGASRQDLLPLIREFYDRGALWLFVDPQNLRDFLGLLVPELVERLGFSRARRENRSFIPADLQEQESDLIVSVPCIGLPHREVWIYLLLEHQSKHDPLMGLRLYVYMGELWRLQRREWEDRKVPPSERRLRPIVPLVFHTGEGAWSTPIGLKHLMDLPTELERFVPAWETPLLNLHQTAPETLTETAGALGWALRVLQAERAPLAEIDRVLTEAIARLEELPEEQAGQWKRVVWFLLLLMHNRREEPALVERVVEQAKRSKFREREEIAAMGLTVAQQIAAKAEAHAELRTCRRILRRQLEERFGTLSAELEQTIEGIEDLQRLESALRQVVHVMSLAELKL
jgi:hypothetical protein